MKIRKCDLKLVELELKNCIWSKRCHYSGIFVGILLVDFFDQFPLFPHYQYSRVHVFCRIPAILFE